MGKIRLFAKEYTSLVFLVFIILLMTIIKPYFITFQNITTVLLQASTYLIIGCGMTFTIIGGQFDLSVGSILALSGVISIVAEPYIGQIPAILLAFLVSVLIGLLNGYLVYKVNISSFITTIGTMYLLKGIALKISGGRPITSQCSWFNSIGFGTFLGLPNMTYYALVLIIISNLILKHTQFGRNVYLVGGNREVAKNSGIFVTRSGIMLFVISAFSAGIGGVLLSSRLNSASALFGDSMSLTVISGVVIGGTSLSGGRGSIAKSMIGILIITIISNSLDILKVFSYYQMIIRGVVVVLIIGLDAYSRFKMQLQKRIL